jgi:hypothetical protein
VDSASPDAIVSKEFRGRHGRAYLFDSVWAGLAPIYLFRLLRFSVRGLYGRCNVAWSPSVFVAAACRHARDKWLLRVESCIDFSHPDCKNTDWIIALKLPLVVGIGVMHAK